MIITVIGAGGGVGQATCAALKTLLPHGTILRMVDVNPAIPGIALDLSHVPTSVIVEGFSANDLSEAFSGTDIVLLTAGMPRKPGMTRDDLFVANATIVRDTLEKIAEYCPDAFIAIVTNPVNSMVPVAMKTLQRAGVYNAQKLCGVTMLDVIRARTMLGHELDKAPENISIKVIGGHSGITILPLLSQVPGNTLTEEENKNLREKIQNAGTSVVQAKSGAGSATLAMGYAGAYFVQAVAEALSGNEREVCAYIATEEEATSFFAKPVLLGKDGIIKELPYDEMNADEKEALQELIPVLKQDIEKGMSF